MTTDSASSTSLCTECEQHATKGSYCECCGHYQQTEKNTDGETLPSGLMKDALSERYILTRQWKMGWFRGAPLVILFFGLLLLLMSMTISESSKQKISMLGFGIIMTGMAIPLLVNSTRVEISSDFLSVKRGPIPIPLSQSFILRRDEIAKLTLTKNKSDGDGTKAGYDLRALNANGEPFDIVQLTDSRESILLLHFILKKMNLEHLK